MYLSLTSPLFLIFIILHDICVGCVWLVGYNKWCCVRGVKKKNTDIKCKIEYWYDGYFILLEHILVRITFCHSCRWSSNLAIRKTSIMVESHRLFRMPVTYSLLGPPSYQYRASWYSRHSCDVCVPKH